MGLPDDGFGLPKRKSRLCLNSKRKVIDKEASIADEHENSSIKCTNEMMAATHGGMNVKDGQNPVAEEIFFSESGESHVAPVSSLYNLGNTCFLNCMLQVLRYTPGFLGRLTALRRYISHKESKMESGEPCGKKKSEKTVWKLVICLDNLYQQMRDKENDYKDISPTDSAMMAIRPDALLDQIKELNSLFEGNFQHDAQELLRCLLGCLDDAELELEKELSERKEAKEKTDSYLSTENTNKIKPETNQRKTKNSEDTYVSEDKSVFSQTTLKTYEWKRKTREKKEECANHQDFTMKANSTSHSASTMASEQNVAGDTQCKNENLAAEAAKANDKLNCNNSDVEDVIFIGEDNGNTSSSRPTLNCAGDAPNNIPSHTSIEAMNLPSRVGTKHISLGIRRQVPSRGQRPNIFDSVRKDKKENLKGEVKLPAKCKEDVNETMVICVSDDEESSSTTSSGGEKSNQSTIDWNFKPTLHGIIEKEEEHISSSSDVMSVSPLDSKESDENSPVEESSPVSGHGKLQSLVLTPGKQLTIHSPQKANEERTGCHSPKLPDSRSFLSRIQGFLPNTAKKYLNFSVTQTNAVNSDSSTVQDPCFTVGELKKLQSDIMVVPDNKAKEIQESLLQAKLQLKRCDWLGVSPVKSISAKFVMTQIKNHPQITSVPQMKRRRTTSCEDDGKGDCKDRVIECEKRRRVMDEKGDQFNKFDKITSEDAEKRENEKRLAKQRVMEDNHDSKNKNQSYDSGRKTANTRTKLSSDTRKQSIDYSGCKIKPFSINLKKLDWLTDSKKQSFSVKEVLRNSNDDVQMQCSGYKKCFKSQQSAKEPMPHFSMMMENKKPTLCHSCPYPQDEFARPVEKLVQGLFGGLMCHRTSCCECDVTSDRPEKFLDISIPVRALSNQSSDESSDEDEQNVPLNKNCVLSLLKSFSSRERLCNDNKYFCDQCFHLVEAEHFCFFQDLPNILTIHLKRFDAGLGSLMGRVSKISDHVEVPDSLPCLKLKQCSNTDCQHRYSLYAIVTHSGSSILRGHYRCYVKVASSFNQQISHYAAGREPSFCTFPSSPLLKNNDSFSPSSGENDSMETNIEEVNSNAFTHSHQLQSATDKQFNRLMNARMERGDEKSWWLECDDEFIRVFDEEDFFERLSGSSDGLLGTPYVIFYHQV